MNKIIYNFFMIYCTFCKVVLTIDLKFTSTKLFFSFAKTTIYINTEKKKNDFSEVSI